MHAAHFWGQGRGLPVGQEFLPVTEKERRREGKEALALGEIWTCKPSFILPIYKRKVQHIQPFIFVPLYLSVTQICICTYVLNHFAGGAK